MNTYNDLQVKSQILHALSDMGFESLTPIQQEVIPYVLDKKDCLAQAPTGTGKTCAFGIPLVDMINPTNSQVQAVILCPTRELARQIEEELRKILKYLESVKVLAVYGGAPFQRQIAALKKRPQIIVGTPGRIIDHLERRTLKLQGVKMVVLDEADEMLNMGFRDDIDTILNQTPFDSQKVLFSATMPKAIKEISTSYQVDPVNVKTTVKESELPVIEQNYIKVKEGNKLEVFETIMNSKGYEKVLIFCNTKRRVDEVERKLNASGRKARALHGDLRQSKRDFVMKGYRNKEFDILVATDVAARGIDVRGIEAIFNYDLPTDDEYYVHRIGRTARANQDGTAYSFASAKDFHRVHECEKYTKTKMTEIKLDGLTDENLNTTKHKVNTTNSVRIFTNVGLKDGANYDKFEKFVCDFAGVDKSEVLEIKLLETYGFIEVVKEKADKVIALSGMNFGKRVVVMEVAGGKGPQKPQRDRNSRGGDRDGFNRNSNRGDRGSRGDRPQRGGRDRRDDDRKPRNSKYNEENPRPIREFDDNRGEKPRKSYDDKPKFDRKPREDRPSYDRKPREDRPSYDRKPRGDKPTYSNKEAYERRKERKPKQDFSLDNRFSDSEGNLISKPRGEYKGKPRTGGSTGGRGKIMARHGKNGGKPVGDFKPRAKK